MSHSRKDSTPRSGPGLVRNAASVTAMGQRVLVVDDDDTVAGVVVDYLRRAGFETARRADGRSALAALAGEVLPDLVILDLMLPEVDGLTVCRELRRSGSTAPVIMLTGLGEEEDRILGLEVGADDYVIKPFSPRELVLRVESVLRRTQPPPDQRTPTPPELRSGPLVIDPAARTVTRDGAEVSLTPREFDLLVFLVSHSGTVFTREELLERVWGWSFGDSSTVTVHLRRLREKVEQDPSAPQLLLTVWGVGYRWAGA